jgi:hypothetical protein
VGLPRQMPPQVGGSSCRAGCARRALLHICIVSPSWSIMEQPLCAVETRPFPLLDPICRYRERTCGSRSGLLCTTLCRVSRRVLHPEVKICVLDKEVNGASDLEVPARHARERVCIVTCIPDTRSRALRSWIACM